MVLLADHWLHISSRCPAIESGRAKNTAQSNQEEQKILLVLRENAKPSDVETHRSREAIFMTSMLEEAGFQVEVASVSGRTFVCYTGGKRFEFDSIKLADVKVSDYEALIFTSHNRKSLYRRNDSIPPVTASIVKQAVAEGKLIAAKRWGIVVLAEAGVLAGKRHAFPVDPQKDAARDLQKATNFNDALFCTDTIVRDGNIITSNKCPYAYPGKELTGALITALQERAP
jgi:putative intracellular protease/amidase